ncbi:hypothetical protein REPUB_Repub07fG0018700 [Reevesia pubescens]
MAVSGLSFACKPHSSFRPPITSCFRQIRFGSVAAIETLGEPETFIKDGYSQTSGFYPTKNGSGDDKLPQWKKLNCQDLGISTSMISKPTKKVLNALKRKGYDVYLVGGCVRDLILKRTPKDFNIITTAELREVIRAFSRCEMIGKRFPICHVHIGDKIVEVSSFSTSGRSFARDLAYELGRPAGCNEKDFVRWRNCLQRDFTINGLMFDPYARIIYDYMGGVEDIKKAKVRTVIPANTSFQEDCARILRAIRIAARLGFSFSRETAHFVKHLSCSILRLDKSRLLMEMNYMLAYGSAEASLRLLWKFGLLEILLPIQAAYFVRTGFRRRDKRSNMFLSLFSKLDRLLAPDRPCHSSLWIGILAFHKALSDKPRDPLVVAAFSLAVHNGGDMSEAVNIVRRINKPYDSTFHELSESQNLENQILITEVLDLAASVKSTLSKMTDEYFVSQAMSAYPQAPVSDLVFIPLASYLKVCKVFECVREGADHGFMAKQGSRIDYESLALGSLSEIRHTFARVVFDTIYPLNLT